MGLSRTICEINGDFSRKLQIPTFMCLTLPLKVFPLELHKTVWPQETRMIGLPGAEKSLTICVAIVHECDRWTERRTPADR